MKALITLFFILTIFSLHAQLELIPQDTGGLTDGRDFEIIIINKTSALDWCNKGMRQFKSSNFEGAIKMCKQGLKFDPECATAYHMMGLSKILFKRVPEGCLNLKKAMVLSDSTKMFARVLFRDYKKMCNENVAILK